MVIVDSGSAAADLELLRPFPVRLHHIPQTDFGHGRTRNRLAELATGELLIFLTQDAEPTSADWMGRLLAPLEDSTVAGVYGRQAPRPGSDLFTRFFLKETYGPEPARWEGPAERARFAQNLFFSNVSCAVRREVWKQIPFRDVVMSEDQYWALDALGAGYALCYEPAACVYHAHDYSLPALFQRNRLSGRSLVGLPGGSSTRFVPIWLRYLGREAAFLIRQGRRDLLPYMAVYEAARVSGFAWGSIEGRLAWLTH